MRKLVFSNHVSLDGYFVDVNGDFSSRERTQQISCNSCGSWSHDAPPLRRRITNHDGASSV